MAVATRSHGHGRTSAHSYRPQTNGKAEGFIRTLLDEWAYGRPYQSNAERLAALPEWLEFYNHGRPTPLSRA